MIEIYAFLGMFAIQVVAMSVLFPTRLAHFARAKDAEYPDEVFATLYPGVDRQLATTRFWNRFRAAHLAIAVVGFVVLAWMSINMEFLAQAKASLFPVLYFLLQLLPLLFLVFVAIRNMPRLRTLPQAPRRTAVLKRRWLFDFVSPLRIILQVSIYLLFVAFMLYLMYGAKDPISKFIGYWMLGAATLGLAGDAAFLYWRMYGKKVPLETDVDRMHSTVLQANGTVYGTLLTVVLTGAVLMLPRLGLQAWLPFTLSTFFVVVALQFSWRLRVVKSQPPAAAPGPTPVS